MLIINYFRWLLVKTLWWSIRWRKRCIYRILARVNQQKKLKIRPFVARKTDGFRADFYVVDEWSEVRRKHENL